MGTYVEQRLKEKRKQLEKLETQLFEVHRQVDLVKAEVATLEDVLKHDKSEDRGRALGKSRPAQNKAPPPPPPKTGHWSGVLAKLGRADRFTIDDVMRELAAIGQPNQRTSVRAKLGDLVAANKIKRIEDGVFTLVSAGPRGVSGDEMRAAGIIPPHARLVGEDA
jgi:hypothetical protein